MFGSAMGDAEKSFQISDGWFANISTIYDPDDTVAPSWLRVDHNAYGYVSAKHNYQVFGGSRGFFFFSSFLVFSSLLVDDDDDVIVSAADDDTASTAADCSYSW